MKPGGIVSARSGVRISARVISLLWPALLTSSSRRTRYSVGAPTEYLVRLLELVNNAGQSKLITRALIRTPLRALTIPPGFMVAGSTYVMVIGAVRNTGVNGGEYPFKTVYP